MCADAEASRALSPLHSPRPPPPCHHTLQTLHLTAPPAPPPPPSTLPLSTQATMVRHLACSLPARRVAPPAGPASNLGLLGGTDRPPLACPPLTLTPASVNYPRPVFALRHLPQTVSKRVANAKSGKFHQNVLKRGVEREEVKVRERASERIPRPAAARPGAACRVEPRSGCVWGPLAPAVSEACVMYVREGLPHAHVAPTREKGHWPVV